MSKTIKTPALENADFAKENTEIILRTFSSVYGNTQINVEAETVEEAQILIEAEIAKINSSQEPEQSNESALEEVAETNQPKTEINN